MISKKEDFFLELKKNISRQKKIAGELGIFSEEFAKESDAEDKKKIREEIKNLKDEMEIASNNLSAILNQVPAVNKIKNFSPKLVEKQVTTVEKNKEKFSFDFFGKILQKKPGLSDFDIETLRRIKRGDEEEKISKKKLKKPKKYVRISNKFFADYSANLVKKWEFKKLQRDLVKSNMNFLLRSYVSVIMFTTLLAFSLSVLIFIFFLFFEISAQFPIILPTDEGILIRVLKTFWIIFLIPAVTAIFMYTYPSFEKDSLETRINLELPFATINMAAISGSMIDPTKIFNIIISTKEYPYLEKEFTKLLNSVNVLGYDLITALRNSVFNTSSKKLAELFNGLAITINSGGDLPKFFRERAQSMLFEYHLEREKNTKAAETFMDIYISVVIAAPMILMLLLMMMRISGLGIPLSTSAITLIMILGVVGINIGFLTFLQLKQPNV